MSKEILEKVKEMVRGECDHLGVPHQWDHHILVVLDYAKKLVKKHPKADREVIELAVYLHDLTRIREFGPKKEHNITGAAEAEKILSRLDYPNDKTVMVRNAVMEHSPGGKPKAIESKILHVADALSHFKAIPYFMWLRGKKHDSARDAMDWVRDKIRDAEKKMPVLPESKKLVKKEYRAFKVLFE